MELYNRDVLENHYKNILKQNKEKLMHGGSGDTFLVSPELDTRMSIALLIRIENTVSDNIKAYLDEIKEMEPDLYIYPKEDFHITVLDILSANSSK